MIDVDTCSKSKPATRNSFCLIVVLLFSKNLAGIPIISELNGVG
jgi:hypothetical protein